MAQFQKPKGTLDFYDLQSQKFRYVEEVAEQTATCFGFKEMITPIFEHTEVFTRSSGEESDIVAKEMYTFLDRAKRSITLRPEGTAPIVRSFIENKIYTNYPNLTKVFYRGPIFRYERPQAGRFRQFHQFGVEVFGDASSLLDADVIYSGYQILQKLSIPNIRVKVNSIGDFPSRKVYQAAVAAYFSNHKDNLCSDCMRRLEKNPMRILDCKVDQEKDFFVSAPKLENYLNEASKQYFQEVLSYLDAFGIQYEIDDNLVRGLDYYTDTVFEYIIDSEDAYNGLAICAGGRYDNLVAELGGPKIGGVGYAFGMERLIAMMDQYQVFPNFLTGAEVMILALDEVSKLEALRLAHVLRNKGIITEIDYKHLAMKQQFKLADRLLPQYLLIIGQEERKQQIISIKDTTEKQQQQIPVNTVVAILLEKLQKKTNSKESFLYENTQ